jgi:hypothetical protein
MAEYMPVFNETLFALRSYIFIGHLILCFLLAVGAWKVVSTRIKVVLVELMIILALAHGLAYVILGLFINHYDPAAKMLVIDSSALLEGTMLMVLYALVGITSMAHWISRGMISRLFMDPTHKVEKSIHPADSAP